MIFLTIPSAANAQTESDPGRYSHKNLTKTLEGVEADVFYGGTMISSDSTVRGNVVVIAGSLDLQEGAVLDGDAWVINGSLVITGDGQITGRIFLINSELFASHSAEATGEISYYTCECRIDDEIYEDDGKIVFVKEEDPLAIKTRKVFRVAKPTRVRYDIIRLGLKHGNDIRTQPHTRWELMVDFPAYFDTQHGYLEFEARASVPLGSNRHKILASGYKTLHTEDSWQVSRLENAMLLVLTSNEYANYYEKRGGELGLQWNVDSFVKTDAAVLYQEDVSMQKSDVFTIFGNDDNLPPNPAIERGRRGALRFSFVLDSREDRDYPQDAWWLGLSVEPGRLYPDAASENDFNYAAFTAQANRYTKLPLGIQWDIGTRLSSSFTRIPTQLYQTLNGYGGIRGTDDAPFDVVRGNRMVRLSTEFRAALPEVPIVKWIYTQWDLLVFADAGYLTDETSPTSPFGFLGTSFDAWKKSVGLGVSGESLWPYIGIYVAREIDGARNRPRFIVRLERSF